MPPPKMANFAALSISISDNCACENVYSEDAVALLAPAIVFPLSGLSTKDCGAGEMTFLLVGCASVLVLAVLGMFGAVGVRTKAK